MITNTTLTTVETTPEDEALRRVVAYAQNSSYAIIPGHRLPRWRVRLAAPEEAGPLFRRARADYKALIRQITDQYKARVATIQSEWATGSMTPLTHGQLLAEAEQERAGREDRVEAAFADLTEERVTEGAKGAAEAAVKRVWRDAQDGHTGTQDGPSAA